MNGKQKEIVTRIVLLIISLIFIGIFATFIIQANIGGDAVLVFEQGFAKFIGIDIGTSILILNVVLSTIIFFIDRKKINIGTVLIALLLGPFMQVILDTGWVYNPNGNLWLSILVDFLAIIGLAMSLSLYIYANIGYSPFEAIVLTIHERKKWRFAYVKMVCDALLFLIGWLLGGVIGIGSIMTIVMLGPLIDFFTLQLKKTNWISTSKAV